MSNRRNFLTPLMLFGGTSLGANTIISVQFQGANNVPVNNSAVASHAASADANFANSNGWNRPNGDCGINHGSTAPSAEPGLSCFSRGC